MRWLMCVLGVWVVGSASACTNDYDFEFVDGGVEPASGGGSGAVGGGGGGGGTSANKVRCGAQAECDPSTEVCCVRNQDSRCLSTGAACHQGFLVECDGPEDCGNGQVCCAHLNASNSNFTSISCSGSGACAGNRERIVCGASGTCPNQQSCENDPVLSTYKSCQ